MGVRECLTLSPERCGKASSLEQNKAFDLETNRRVSIGPPDVILWSRLSSSSQKHRAKMVQSLYLHMDIMVVPHFPSL